MSQDERAYADTLLKDLTVVQDARGILGLDTFCVINAVQRKVIYLSIKDKQAQNFEARIRLLTETPDDYDAYDRALLEHAAL